MLKLIVIPSTPMPANWGFAAWPRREEPRALYSPNVRISAQRATPREAEQAITEFFEYGGFDPDKVAIDEVRVEK